MPYDNQFALDIVLKLIECNKLSTVDEACEAFIKIRNTVSQMD